MLSHLASIALLVLLAGNKAAFAQEATTNAPEAATNDQQASSSNNNNSTFDEFMSSAFTQQCLASNSQDMCRFNADCCSKLCTTFNLPNPRCVENTPQNHLSDSFATAPARPDFTPTKFDGMGRWKDKVAVVTGAASGIGFALAKRLCMEGMIVVGVDINDAGVKQTAKHCPQGSYHPMTADLRREEEIVKLFQNIEKAVGRVDVLVNNAGVTREFSLINVSSEGLHTMIDLNLKAPILCTREALKIMMAKNITSGYIMYTNSIHGSMIAESRAGEPSRDIYVYEAAKHALKVVREGLRQELRAQKSRIRVGEVSPASVITNIPEGYIPRDQADKPVIQDIWKATSGINTQDRLSPDDIAEAFVYMLAAPERMDVNTILVNTVPKV